MASKTKQPLVSDKDIEDGKYTVEEIDACIRPLNPKTHMRLIDFWLDVRLLVAAKQHKKVVVK